MTITQGPLNITLVIASMGAGGAERVMSLLAGEWQRRGNRVTLITLSDTSSDHYAVAPGVHRIALDVLGSSHGKVDALQRNFSRLRRIRGAVRTSKPDVVISFMDSTNVLTLIATRGLSIPVIVSERIDPRYYMIGRGWQRLRRMLYPKADAIVVQTGAVAQWAAEFVAASKVRVIANPVEILNTVEGEVRPDWMPSQPFILAMGRLDKQKGFDLLLRAYADLAQDERPMLLILGEGPERAALEDLISEVDLSKHVLLPGRVKNPGALLSSAHLFVMSSRYEGFPNALLEGMAAGLPVISFDCPSGPGEIIQNGRNGILVPAEDVSKLSEAMARLLQNPAEAKGLGRAARSVVDDFSLTVITDNWDDLLAAVSVKRKRRAL